MRVIQKKISLEDVTSRLPGVVPAYRERDGKIYAFDDASLKDREYAFPSNYGMIPRFVKIPNSINVPLLSSDSEGGECENSGRLLSWERISDWYHFFTDYYHLLNDWGHCGLKYHSAEEYYDRESKNGYEDQLVYGSAKETYLELDRLFDERGGNDMYRYISNTLIPSMDIPVEYSNYWHATKLYYPDIIRWRRWFKKRESYSSDPIGKKDNCSKAADCCDCAEYFDRGGSDMANALETAYNAIQTIIPTIETCDPYIETDVSMQVSIDDLGEFSILSNEYELGIDYRVADGYGQDENTKGGTVVAISGQAMTLEDYYPGFGFNEEYMEKVYDPTQWTQHKGDKEIDGIPEENDDTRYYQDGRPTGFYAFNYRDEKIIRSTEDDVRNALSEEYEITRSNSIYIHGVLYDIKEEEYGLYRGDNNKKLYVYREKYTQTPYTILNGQKIYADVKPQNKDTASETVLADYFYFSFFPKGSGISDITRRGRGNCDAELVFKGDKYKGFPRQRSDTTEVEEFIEYNNGFCKTSDAPEGSVRIDGYVFIDEETVYAGNDGKVYTVDDYGNLEENNNYTYDSVAGTITRKVNYETKIYDMSVITGYSASKLYGLRSNNLLTDDVGDVIQGRYDVTNKSTHQPPEGEELELIYEVGNTSRVIPFSGAVSEAGDNYYFGDIITSMTFYYKDYEGNRSGETTINLDTVFPGYFKTSLDSIHSATRKVADALERGELQPDIYCEIQYIIGATLSGEPMQELHYYGDYPVNLDTGIKYSLAKTSEGYSNGVLYTEEVQFVKTEVQYKLSSAIWGQIPTTKDSVSAHTLCYPVVCYILKQKEVEIDSDFGSKYMYPLAKFEMKFPPYSGWKGYNNSLEIFPVFRQEYLLGSATMQNVDVDIYIDRGINAAFEKHLKLGEVTSMEALEQYTNGYYKMMEN